IRERISAEAARFDARGRGAFGKREGGHVAGVVHAADDDGQIRIAVLEGNDDFLSDARPEEGAVSIARPDLGDTHPAGAAGVDRPVTVPVEMDLDPAILIDKHRLPGGAGYRGRLWSGNDRPGRYSRRPLRQRLRHARKGVLI